ncbi:putative reverse transcriptase domain-containing protein [Tanacetum coccineum]
MSEYRNDGSLAMLTMYFSNAFNLVDRSALLHEVRVSCPSISLWVDFLYGQSARLYIGDTHILSATEVQQGDPLRPLLFALVLHPLVHKIRDSCKLLLHAWYLDDGTIIGDSEEVAQVLDIIKLYEGLFPVDIRRSSLGVKLLGRAVSRVTNFISGMVMRRAANAVDLINLLPYGICGMDDDYVSALAYLRDAIPSFDFSCFTNKDIAPSKAQQILASALFSEMVKDMEIHFDMTVRQKAVLSVYVHHMRVGISAKKEAHVKFLTDPSDRISTLRPANVLVFGWVEGKHACVDLTEVYPLVGLSSQGFTMG